MIDLSRQGDVMMKRKYGYRNDELYGSGVTSVKEIITYEAYELGNVDIFETCKLFYNIDYKTTKYLNNIDACTKKTMNFLHAHFKTDKISGLWLALRKDVMEFYEGREGVTKYIIPEDAIAISDLGGDGLLFVAKGNWTKKCSN